ncbi:protein serine/threonine phosphatase [Gloeothece citriformis PCC 7424]|uniref:Protein serine/threonine phosphatase n=1 Tax=Gloeothece citriformis (strain PCC 7424) TaxID=65393 RepID=B7K812_GLOC7|nr:serine/threonine phosphatase [Gloeothece citriformis]ACK68500.1 protein serine/threonine phosphatase [Gloeothece citriformis PCC 7424]
MLICPQCQYDNPNHSQSCQRCGVSLAEKPCPECGTMVSFEEQNCPNCGAFTATRWWALITPNSPSLSALETRYLDPGERYRLIMESDLNLPFPLPPQTPDKDLGFQALVMDCQPLQKSVLKSLLEQQEEWLNAEDNPQEENSDRRTSLWHQIGIPQRAFPYLKTRQFSPIIPDIHEAWHDGNQEVILLDDRISWQLLSQFWAREELPMLQIVYWLNEMASLWTPLTEVGCCQSLLVENNLRVDEDQSFGLLRLYEDRDDRQPTLQDLGRMWQQLLHQSKSDKKEALDQLLKDLISGQINQVEQLCLQLQYLAEQEQLTSDEVGKKPLFSEDSDDDYGDVDTVPLPSNFFQEDDSFDTDAEHETIIEGCTTEEFSTADLPMQLLSITDVGHTDTGRLRRHNEDHFALLSDVTKHHSNRGQTIRARGLYIVCDGMGGHASGEVASAIAVKTLQDFFATHWEKGLPDAETIEKAIFLANDAIYKVNQDKDSYGAGRMGTTLVMMLLEGTQVAIAHVGDSRIYQINRKWGLQQLTVDHEVGQKAVQEGVEPQIAYSRPDAYQLTQALGPHESQYIKPDIKYLDLHEDTLLLLCSDGLSDNKFLEIHYSSCLTPLISSGANLDEGLEKLFALANQKNGHDNITAILVRIKLQPCFD